MFKIEFDKNNGKTELLYVYGDESILTELEYHNVLINHNCRQGHCGNCILYLVEGEVVHQESLIPLSLSPKEILACQSRPITDIKVKIRE